jgi:hypothetical protein
MFPGMEVGREDSRNVKRIEKEFPGILRIEEEKADG